MVWLKKGGGDNGEKCRKRRMGELDCRQRPFTLPPLTVHLQGNAMVTWCVCVRAHVCLENVELKPAMKCDVGGIDLFFLRQHWQGKIFMNMVIWHLPSSRPARQHSTQTRCHTDCTTLDDLIWLRLRKLLLPSKRHRILWRSNTQTHSVEQNPAFGGFFPLLSAPDTPAWS